MLSNFNQLLKIHIDASNLIICMVLFNEEHLVAYTSYIWSIMLTSVSHCKNKKWKDLSITLSDIISLHGTKLSTLILWLE